MVVSARVWMNPLSFSVSSGTAEKGRSVTASASRLVPSAARPVLKSLSRDQLRTRKRNRRSDSAVRVTSSAFRASSHTRAVCRLRPGRTTQRDAASAVMPASVSGVGSASMRKSTVCPAASASARERVVTKPIRSARSV